MTDDSSSAAHQSLKHRFPKQSRLLTKSDFERVYQQRCRAGDGVLLMFAWSNGQPRTRLGLSVSRKVGNAVVRNRIKRWLREAFRLSQHELPVGLDLIVIPTDISRAAVATYQNSLRKLSHKLARRLTPPATETPAAETPS